jgi:hypothetical protein
MPPATKKRSNADAGADEHADTSSGQQRRPLLSFVMPDAVHCDRPSELVRDKDSSSGGWTRRFTTEPTYKHVTIRPRAGVHPGFKKVDHPALAKLDFELTYKRDDACGYGCEHILCIEPKVPISLRVTDHEELFNYAENACYEVEPHCPICKKCNAEVYHLDPITEYLASKGFDCNEFLDDKLNGPADEYGMRFAVCGSGHMAAVLPEDPDEDENGY